MVDAEPSRSDYYAMQIAMEVRRVLSKHPNQIKLSHFKLKFEDKDAKSKVDYKKLAPYSIATWKAALSGAWNKMVGAKKAEEQKQPSPPTPNKPIPQRKRRGAR